MSSLHRSLTVGLSKKKNVRFGGKIVDVLQEHSQGIFENLNMLLSQIGDPTARSTEIIDWYQQCIEDIHLLDKQHHKLVEALLKIQWVNREKEVVTAFYNFVISLVTCNPIYLRAVIKSLTNCFQPRLSKDAIITSITGMSDDEVFRTIHSIFKSIFTVIPHSASIAKRVYSECFPYYKKPTETVACYVKNLLIITTYFPGSLTFFLELIVKHLIEIDVNSPKHEIEDLEEEFENEETVFEMDIDDGAMKKDGNVVRMKHRIADKLDVLMNMLFQYIHGACYKDGELQQEDSANMLKCLLSVFDNLLLPVYGTVHVQFLVFYICSFHQNFCSTFLEHCWKSVTSPHIASIYRQSSCCYIGSLLARADFLPLVTVTKWLNIMTKWTSKYIKEYTDLMSSDSFFCDIRKHGTLYSVSEAIFYVIIFRHKEILNSKKGRNYILDLNLQHLITSQLNPLQACQKTIVNLFSSTMRMHQLVYCDTIVDRNNRQMINAAASSSNPLDSFFPFDPYLLKRSLSVIKPLYRGYEGSLPTQQKHVFDGDNDVSMEEFLEKIDDNNFTPSSLNNNFYGTSPLAPGFNYLANSPF